MTAPVRPARGSKPPRPHRCTCHPDFMPLPELAVIALLAESMPLDKIAAETGYTVQTIRTYIARARGRLEAQDRMQLVVEAFRRQLIGFDQTGRVVVMERRGRAVA